MIGIDTTFLVQLEIVELPQHARAHQLLQQQVLDPQLPLLLAPQVLSEFLHIVTDPRRFQRPLVMSDAIDKARFWWNAREVLRVYPTSASTTLFLDWLAQYRLGRKRLLDTQLAATLWNAGARQIFTSNARDFEGFGFAVLSP